MFIGGLEGSWRFLFQYPPYKIHKFTNTDGWIIVYFAFLHPIL